jgi:hypothetical protein
VEVPIEFVTLMVGDGLPDLYVDRLYGMLARWCPPPFRLTCLTDRARPLRPEVRQWDISAWTRFRPDMRPTQHKLRLFDAESAPYPEAIYLDVTLVIRSDLTPLLQDAERDQPLVIVDDWNHDTVNSCVMRIRTPSPLQAVYNDYAQGVKYPVRLLGDQDYLDAALRAHDLMPHVAFFRPESVVSYRGLRKRHRRDPEGARRELQAATILKFHGTPRPHELFGFQNRLRDAMRAPGHILRDWGYLAEEVRAQWR